MSAAIHRYRNSLTGLVADLTEDQASTNPDYLYIVADDAKPFEPGLFKPGTVGEFANPEPPTDAEIAAQAELDAASEVSGPNSKAAKEAKANLVAAHDAAAVPAEGDDNQAGAE